jgi:hypothetical protein
MLDVCACATADILTLAILTLILACAVVVVAHGFLNPRRRVVTIAKIRLMEKWGRAPATSALRERAPASTAQIC